MAETGSIRRGVRTRMTLRERLYVYHRLNGERAYQAVLLAGFPCRSDKTASVKAATLDKRPLVRAALDAGIEAAMPADEVKVRLSEHARADVTDILAGCYSLECTPDGQAYRTFDVAKARRLGLGHLVKSVTPTRYGDKVELHDSQAALVHLGRHHKLWVDRVDVTDATDIKQLATEQLKAIVEGRPIGPQRQLPAPSPGEAPQDSQDGHL
jgi:hypothetical protein